MQYVCYIHCIDRYNIFIRIINFNNLQKNAKFATHILFSQTFSFHDINIKCVIEKLVDKVDIRFFDFLENDVMKFTVSLILHFYNLHSKTRGMHHA